MGLMFSLLQVYGKTGDFKSAMNTFLFLKDKKYKGYKQYAPNSFTYSSLMQMFANKGFYKEALELFDEMKRMKIPVQVENYNILLWSYAKRYDFLLIVEER